jgi:hypothetical protein
MCGMADALLEGVKRRSSSMATSPDDVLAILNGLIAHDYEEIASHEAALRRLGPASEDDATELRQFTADHRRHVARLTLLVYTLGGRPAIEQGPDLSDSCERDVFVGETAILQAVKRNEDAIRRAYLGAVARYLSNPIRAVLEENLRDELKHCAWLEQRLGEKPPLDRAG